MVLYRNQLSKFYCLPEPCQIFKAASGRTADSKRIQSSETRAHVAALEQLRELWDRFCGGHRNEALHVLPCRAAATSSTWRPAKARSSVHTATQIEGLAQMIFWSAATSRTTCGLKDTCGDQRIPDPRNRLQIAQASSSVKTFALLHGADIQCVKHGVESKGHGQRKTKQDHW